MRRNLIITVEVLLILWIIVGCRTPPLRLVSDDYPMNHEQFDAVFLPEAWYYMQDKQDKWVSENSHPGPWPHVVIIDDGFFDHLDLHSPMTTGPGYVDLTTSMPSSQGGGPFTAGYHGTAVATLLGGTNNNLEALAPSFNRQWNAASVAGPWHEAPNGLKWGIELLPVRLAAITQANPEAMIRGLRYAAGLEPAFTSRFGNTNSVRVVNISKEIVPDNDFTATPDDLTPLLISAFSQISARPNATVVIASGNDGQIMDDKGWLAQFDHVVLVGALNKAGDDYWDNGTNSTRRGAAIDLYAPGEQLAVHATAPEGISLVDGSSFAAPIVSGILAMMWNANPCMSASAHVQVLIDTGNLIRAKSNGDEIRRVNAFGAVKTAYEMGDINGAYPCSHRGVSR